MNKKIIFLIIGLAVIVIGIYAQQKSHSGSVSGVQIAYDKSVKVVYGKPIRVARVVDGDTIVLINGDSLRYIGIDTPEEVDPRKPVQCYAKEAAEYNKQLVDGKDVVIYKDVTTKDQYGRWLGFVYLTDGTFVNEQLVKNGDAFAYPYKPDTSKAAQFDADQTAAKSANLGLWATCTVTKLSSGREQTNTLQ